MIPYDDLVVALAAWRARQGLPVAQVADAAPSPPPRAPTAPPAPRASTAPPVQRAPTAPPAQRAAPPSAPPRAAPPSAPPRASAPPQAPASSSDFDEGEGAMVEDGSYDSGDDFVVPFGNAAVEQSGESTAIGAPPEVSADGLLVTKRGKRNPDW